MREHGRAKNVIMLRLLLLLMLQLQRSDAFTMPINVLSTQGTQFRSRRHDVSHVASAVEDVLEAPQDALPDDDQNLLPSVVDPTKSIQVRSFDTVINASILIIAIVTVLTTVLSVDVGITRGWSAEEIAFRIPLDNWRSYNNILSMAPIETKAVTSATVYTIGDIISQQTSEDKSIGELDRGRILRSALAGLIGHGPMSHVWYRVSEDFFDNVLHLHAWWDFLPKIVVDQFVFGPIWVNAYILLLGVMQLQGPGQIFADMKRSTIPLVISGLKLWPFVHIITYGLIPVENRLLWVDLVEIVWVTILANQVSTTTEVTADDDKDR